MAPMAVTLQGVARMGPFVLPFTVPGVRCVPLFSSISQTTNIGPLVILGMPFFRQYATLFNRTSQSMAFAEISADEGRTLCAAGCNSTLGAWLADYEQNHPADAGDDAAHDTRGASNEHLARPSTPRTAAAAAAADTPPRPMHAAASSLQPEQLSDGSSAPRSAAAPAGAATSDVLRLEDVRWPWWAVDPAQRPPSAAGTSHAQRVDGTAVGALEAGESTWRLVL